MNQNQPQSNCANDENDTEYDVDEPLPKRRRGESIAYEAFKAFESLAECFKELIEGLIQNTTWCSKEILKRINQELFSLETNSNLAETPITIETQSIESEPSTKIALLTANDNSTETVRIRGRGRPRKTDLVRTSNVTQKKKIKFTSAIIIILKESSANQFRDSDQS
ncbi:hypothetical protein BpHYR1_048808 [Brachionus plicatilis]|uniref:Uncharacterized protein n=1 Tax=Brachionus plicatilis TaxID=10195 RepID=A0A3M7SN28_BRAPC|nr:hypothetical protein BpHYR1_048808 [Brachionus plicatilis]